VLSRDLTLPALVARTAADDPDRVFAQEVTGASVTYGELHAAGLRSAAAFGALGVGPGDPVVTMLPTSIESVRTWLGLACLGAVDLPVNTDYRGRLLGTLIAGSGAKVMVVAERFLDRLPELDLGGLQTVVVPDADGDAVAVDVGIPAITAAQFLAGATPVADGRLPDPWDPAYIICTSGTTGPSKRVIVPWAQAYATATGIVARPEDLDEHDVVYAPLPMYHIANRGFVYLAAIAGARVVLREKMGFFEIWSDIEKFGITVGAMGPPPYPDETTLRIAGGNRPIPDYEAVAAKLGIQLTTCYSMTELSVPLRSGAAISHPDSCGRVREGFPGYEVRVVDEHDAEVAPGVRGELVVRTSEPWTLTPGYVDMPEESLRAWRNGWFHTGDIFTYDEEGNFFFVDRIKDAIRRRGENISSVEVEACVNEHPQILDSAAIGVPTRDGEADLKIVVMPFPGNAPTPEELLTFLVPRMPRFMIPRYVEFMDDLPRTEATFKVQKVKLREDALNEHTWDREAAGFELPR
jgi:crotonobetaine/carnitine-CoA ligase